ncbi:MAG: hypothetical protein ABIT38_01035, partial [Gemmatimonadaceae bacterium]
MRVLRELTLLALLATASCSTKSDGDGKGDEGATPGAQPASTPVTAASSYGKSGPEAQQFATLADEYLDGWAKFYPSIAGGNGLHAHDGELEDFSAPAMASQVAWFRDMKAKVDAIPADRLPPDERVDRRILSGIIDGWILDIEVAKSWQRNPMVYASAVSDGVHNLMTME